MLHLFIQHTSAAITLNENYDPDVRTDMDRVLDKIVPESFDWKHVDEGPDDSVSHTKSTLVGPSVQIPIGNGKVRTFEGTRQSPDAVWLPILTRFSRPLRRSSSSVLGKASRSASSGTILTREGSSPPSCRGCA